MSTGRAHPSRYARASRACNGSKAEKNNGYHGYRRGCLTRSASSRSAIVTSGLADDELAPADALRCAMICCGTDWNHNREFSEKWRRGWDSNPRYAYTHGGFQDRCLQPLGHLSCAHQGLTPEARAASLPGFITGCKRGNTTKKGPPPGARYAGLMRAPLFFLQLTRKGQSGSAGSLTQNSARSALAPTPALRVSNPATTQPSR